MLAPRRCRVKNMNSAIDPWRWHPVVPHRRGYRSVCKPAKRLHDRATPATSVGPTLRATAPWPFIGYSHALYA